MSDPVPHLFTLLPDELDTVWDVFARRITAQGAAATLLTDAATWRSVFPVDRTVWLKTINLSLAAGTAQRSMNGYVDVVDGVGNSLSTLFGTSQSQMSGPVAGILRAFWQGDVCLPATHMALIAGGDFDAGTNSNTLHLSVTGYTTPRGNARVR